MARKLYLSVIDIVPGGPGGGSGYRRINRMFTYTQGFAWWDFGEGRQWAVNLVDDLPDAILDSIDADTDIYSLSPRGSTNQQIQTWLADDLLETDELVTEIEARLFTNMAWRTPGTTRRHAMRYISRMHKICALFNQKWALEKFQGDNNPDDWFELLRLALNMQLRDVPQRARQKIVPWLQSLGADLSPLGPTDTIRQALQLIISQLQPPETDLGDV